jgi:hypothetical protein
MSYQVRAQYSALSTAGKITVFTALGGLVTFLVVFLLNLGQSEIKNVAAQTTDNATTSVNILNTPPEFLNDADEPREEFESSATNPTNSGDEVSFIATATDQNSAPYFLIVCATNAATAATGTGTGTAAPTCDNNDQIAISTSTVSGQQARAATTTTEAMPESNEWWAFACDDDDTNPECSPGFQGTTTFDSPFVVNHRPVFSAIANDGPVDPGGVLTFNASSSDQDELGVTDTMQLIVCAANDYSTTTNACGPGGTIATSTLVAGTTTIAITAATTTSSPLQDDNYAAYVFLVDNHGHEASGGQQGVNNSYDVANVAPTLNAGFIDLSQPPPALGSNIILDTPAGESTDFTLSFVVADDNSCENAIGGNEIPNWQLSVFRSGIGSTSCDGTGANYDPNNCYESGYSGTSGDWGISCLATTTGPQRCTGPEDTDVLYECTFPLWYVADPTDSANIASSSEDWRAAVSGIDDNGATSTFEVSTTANIDVVAFLAFELDSDTIPYGDLAPDSDTGSTNATTSSRATGNVGIDQTLGGLRMCPEGFAFGTCPITSTSSIAASQQEFGVGPFSYGAGQDLPGTTTPFRLEINVNKPTATSSQPSALTYWGIGIPDTITLAGLYTGQNEFIAVVSSSTEW